MLQRVNVKTNEIWSMYYVHITKLLHRLSGRHIDRNYTTEDYNIFQILFKDCGIKLL